MPKVGAEVVSRGSWCGDDYTQRDRDGRQDYGKREIVPVYHLGPETLWCCLCEKHYESEEQHTSQTRAQKTFRHAVLETNRRRRCEQGWADRVIRRSNADCRRSLSTAPA